MTKVLCFGSFNIDYVYQVDHFVGKGETLTSDRLQVFPGGKGLNQAVALGRAGCRTFMAGRIGQDGCFLLETLHESGVDTSLVETAADEKTGNAMIQRDNNGDNCILLYAGANRGMTRAYIDGVLSAFSEGDCIVLQNEINELEYLVEQAHAKKMLTVLNPSPMDACLTERVYEHADWVLLNEVEAMQLTGCDLEEKEALFQALAKRLPHAQIVLTMGQEGSYYIGKERTIHQEIYQVKVVDTTAAGDTFTGFFVSSVISGATVEEGLKRASKAASIAVSRPGAAPSVPFGNEV